MSVAAATSLQPSEYPDSLVPRLPSEIANSTGPNKLHMFAEDDDSPSFWDFLDVINPLQHIPIVNDLYRDATGDKIGVGARLVGGTLFGGPLGLIGAAVNAVLEEATGKDAGGHLIALFKDDAPTTASPATALASAQAPNPGAEVPASPAAAAAGPLPGDKPDAARTLLLPDIAGLDTPPPPAAAPQAAIAQAAVIQAQVAPAAAAQASAAPPPATPPETPAAAKPTQIAALPVEAVDGKPLPLLAGRQPRLMPVPARTTPIATQSPPAVGTTMSNNSTRSNTPVTGSRPNRPVITPAMAQEMAQTQTSANAATAATGDWFSGAMMQGLSRYERNAKAGQGAAP